MIILSVLKYINPTTATLGTEESGRCRKHLVTDLGSGGLGLGICEHHKITICVLNLKTREKV